MRICISCTNKELNFKSAKKIDYRYCKTCWKTLIKINKLCGCKKGFLRKCIFYNDCNNYVRCEGCKSGWINEYCDWCQ